MRKGEGGLTPRNTARNLILGALEREVRIYGEDAYAALDTHTVPDTFTLAVILHLQKELDRLQKKWGWE